VHDWRRRPRVECGGANREGFETGVVCRSLVVEFEGRGLQEEEEGAHGAAQLQEESEGAMEHGGGGDGVSRVGCRCMDRSVL
jgi:hypothetical protein